MTVKQRILTTIALFSAAAPAARAVDRHWNVASGLWSHSANWNPSAVPAGLDNAIVTQGFSRLSTNTVPAVTSVTVTTGGTLALSGTLAAGTLLVGTDVIVGSSNHHGALNVLSSSPFVVFTGGMTIVDRLRLGVLSGSGTVTQNAGTMIVGNGVVIGDSKDTSSTFNPGGAYYLSGGLLRTPQLNVGSHITSNGSFNLAGGVLDCDDVRVGSFGVGVFNHTAGSSTVTQLRIGTGLLSPPPGTNAYNMSGGSLSAGATTISRNGLLNYSGGSAWLGHVNLYGTGRMELNGSGLQMYTLHFQDPTVQARIDIKSHRMEVNFTGFEQIDEIRSGAHLAYAGGSWTGMGLTSSAAAATAASAHRTGVGYGLGGIGLIVRHTYFGDANVDGAVDISDFAALAANFNRTSRYWYHGDFNYDGNTGIADFSMLAANFNQVLPADLPRLTVPEPAFGAVAGALAIHTARRRRRCAG